jgi:hypothetical protein
MCRSIKRLRGPEGVATEDEIREAALQFVRKVSGFRQPSQRNVEAFEEAVDEVQRPSGRLHQLGRPLDFPAQIGVENEAGGCFHGRGHGRAQVLEKQHQRRVNLGNAAEASFQHAIELNPSSYQA